MNYLVPVRPAIDLARIPDLGDWGEFTELGLKTHRCPNKDELRRAGRILNVYGRKLERRVMAWQFVFGDWVDLCEQVLGEDAATMIDELFPNVPANTKRGYVYVSRAIPPALRRAPLNYSVYKEIAYNTTPENRADWVDYAASPQADGERPTVEDIREALHPHKDPAPHYITVELACPDCGTVHTVQIELDKPARIVHGDSGITILK